VILILAYWPEANQWVAVLTATVWISDMMDGTLARRFGLGTEFGPFIDWLGDKLYVLSVFIAFTAVDLVPAWITIVLVAREIVIMQLRYYCLGRGVTVESGMLGKLKLAGGMLAIIAVAAGGSASDFVLAAALILSILSALDYSVLAVRALRSQTH
jgi:CDP-diacylglycerol--glycerol-3-phosphate 3-phosphatidyltransferase